MFTLHISNGYRIATTEGGWDYVEGERFVLSFEKEEPLTDEVMNAVHKHLGERKLYRTYMSHHLFLTDEERELVITYSPNKKITDYGVSNGDTLYMASNVR